MAGVEGGWATRVVWCIQSQVTGSPPLLFDMDILCEMKHEELSSEIDALHTPGNEHVRRHQQEVDLFLQNFSDVCRNSVQTENRKKLIHKQSQKVSCINFVKNRT